MFKVNVLIKTKYCISSKWIFKSRKWELMFFESLDYWIIYLNNELFRLRFAKKKVEFQIVYISTNHTSWYWL